MEIKNEEGDKTRCLAQVGGGAESQLGSIRDNDYCSDDDDMYYDELYECVFVRSSFS